MSQPGKNARKLSDSSLAGRYVCARGVVAPLNTDQPPIKHTALSGETTALIIPAKPTMKWKIVYFYLCLCGWQLWWIKEKGDWDGIDFAECLCGFFCFLFFPSLGHFSQKYTNVCTCARGSVAVVYNRLSLGALRCLIVSQIECTVVPFSVSLVFFHKNMHDAAAPLSALQRLVCWIRLDKSHPKNSVVV